MNIFKKICDVVKNMCACHKELEVKPTPTEKDIDQALDDSFPASDPPSYNIP